MGHNRVTRVPPHIWQCRGQEECPSSCADLNPLTSFVRLRIYNKRSPQYSVVDVVTRVWAGGSVVRFPAGVRARASLQNLQTRFWGLAIFLFSGYWGLCLLGQIDCDVKLTLTTV